MERFIRRSTKSCSLGNLPKWECDLLCARGIDTAQKAEAFLHPAIGQISDPFLLAGMDRAVFLIREAKRARQRVIVWGDYDADGVCASTVLHEALTEFGLECAVYLPDRHKEGYGLNKQAVAEIAKRGRLLITVDCGITAHEEVQLAKELGMTVIVTDHHHLPDVLPEADAVISPLRPPYPYAYLCGTGVAWQMARALLGKEKAMDLLDLAAVATVADIVPLTGENRCIVYEGLKKLNQSPRIGLKALKNVSRLEGNITAEDIGFKLAPRINACGRLESAYIALELLQCTDAQEAASLAARVDGLNVRRKEVEESVLEGVSGQLESYDLCEYSAVVLCGESFESGVVGLAAGKIAERLGYPTVILSRQEDLAVGSARSACGVDIYQALSACRDLFLRFGGHEQAAGMTLRYADIPLFRKRLSDAVKTQLSGKILMPEREYDTELPLEEVCADTYFRMQSLAPFGRDNPEPVFLCRNARPLADRAVGANGAHLKLMLAQGSAQVNGIAFSMGHMAGRLGSSVDALFSVTENQFAGHVSYECRLSALHVNAEGLRENKIDFLAAVLQDISLSGENIYEIPVLDASMNQFEEALRPGQGVLLFCRSFERAMQVHKSNPDLPVCVGSVSDMCAYNAILCGASVLSVRGKYKTVFLMDGQTNENEGALWHEVLPDAQIFAFGKTAYLKKMLKSACLNQEEMRRVIAAALNLGKFSFESLCTKAELTNAGVLGALFVFRELGLVNLAYPSLMPGLILPMKKVKLEHSRLWRLMQEWQR